LAVSASFLEVYGYLIENGFTAELAFRRTFRLKRGYGDTSIPGCYAREAAYYEGMLEVRDHLNGGGDIKQLYSAKAGVEDLGWVESVEGVRMAGRLTKRNEVY
jgi:hypothetical protein